MCTDILTVRYSEREVCEDKLYTAVIMAVIMYFLQTVFFRVTGVKTVCFVQRRYLMLKLAVYGKGGIGKSTMTSNLAAAFASLGKKVIQIGCDPKADSTINLLGGKAQQPVMEYLRDHDSEPGSIEEISQRGYGNILCIETG